VRGDVVDHLYLMERPDCAVRLSGDIVPAG
jgi:hypothetical protein